MRSFYKIIVSQSLLLLICTHLSLADETATTVSSECNSRQASLSNMEQLSSEVRAVMERYGQSPEKVACMLDPNDPFDPGAVMHTEDLKDRGICMDTNEFRVPVVLPTDNPDVIKIANFRYARRWYIATIPKHHIAAAFIEYPRFVKDGSLASQVMVGIAKTSHVQLRFEMDPDFSIELQPQVQGAGEAGPIYVKNVIADFQPTSPALKPGEVIPSKTMARKAKDLLRGDARTGQNIITRFISIVDRGGESIGLDYHSAVNQVELNLNGEQRAHLLDTAIRDSVRDGYTREYDILHFNCAVDALHTLDDAFPPKAGMPENQVKIVRHAFNLVIGPTQKALLARGLIRKDSPQYTLNDEAGDGGIGYLEKLRDHDGDDRDQPTTDPHHPEDGWSERTRLRKLIRTDPPSPPN